MANTFLRKTSRGIGNTAVTVGDYTVTSNLGAVVVGLSISNITGDEIGADVVINNGTSDYYVLKDAPIPNGSTLIAAGKDQKIILQSGDSVKVRSTDDASIDVVMSILETASVGLTVDGGGGGGSPVTYTKDVDYVVPAGLYINTNGTVNMTLFDSSWSNTAGLAILQAQPIGSVFTVEPDGWTTSTFTTTGVWTNISGSMYQVTGTWGNSEVFTNAGVLNITFTPQ